MVRHTFYFVYVNLIFIVHAASVLENERLKLCVIWFRDRRLSKYRGQPMHKIIKIFA